MAADLPPGVVAGFTRGVQPLLLNRCGAGACHGGPAAHEPTFRRVDVGGSVNRAMTLANIETLLRVVGPDRDPQALVALLAETHPAGTRDGRFAARPLTARERRTIEGWLGAVRVAESRPRVVATARPSVPSTQPDNRFRAMLDAAANPPQLPHPEEPRGLIFPRDEPPY